MMKKIIKKIKNIIQNINKPKILNGIETIKTMKPRLSALSADKNILCYGGKNNEIFNKITADRDIIFSDFEKHHKVLIKINLNAAYPYPASTEPELLNTVLDILISIGIKYITVGDCSSNRALPTRNVMKKTGLTKVIKGKADAVYFDEGKWVSVPIDGEYLDEVTISNTVYEADKIIYIANTKNHKHADFSMSMKHVVGFVHPLQRIGLHKNFLHEKAVEMNMAVQPDLIILDARETFVTMGPNEGKIVKGSKIYIGWDLLSVDLRGYSLLYELKEKNNCIGDFTKNPYEMRQFKHAKKVFGKGGKS